MSSFLDGRELELLALGRVCIAVLVGAIIGFERELAEKPAGLRTHMLVAGSAALFVGLGDPFFTGIVGGAIAMGQYVLAVGSALVLLATLRVVGLLERRFL